ncbi:hypothetical protein Sjap_013640 [Stephania japonica]|uniref:Uncharacterized protein n=1 Tax=Stephania japonica TaxID=461633 RepID=A0AAP0J034_9MAGN
MNTILFYPYQTTSSCWVQFMTNQFIMESIILHQGHHNVFSRKKFNYVENNINKIFFTIFRT